MKEIEKKPSVNSPAFWFVSHCETPSKREEFAKELEKHIDVDVFGECGSKYKNPGTDPCKGIKDWKNSAECNINLFNSYKFYLAFENSLCDEYDLIHFHSFKQFNQTDLAYSKYINLN